MYYLQSRYYDPETGRFLNADDVDYIGYSGEQLSYNAFAYCENEPVVGWDPTGTLCFRTTVVAFALDCLFTILGPSFKYGYDVVGYGLKLIARKYGYKSFANKLLYSVVPKFRGLFSKFFTTIRTAVWRITGSFLSNTTNNFFVHIGKYISRLYKNGKYYTIYSFIATFLSAGSLVAAFMAWSSTGDWLSKYIYL